MRSRRPSDDMRDVEDELHVARMLARVREDARKMFELFDSQLAGVQQKLSDEAREKAQDSFEGFDDGDIEAVLRIAGSRLTGRPADDAEYRQFLERIGVLGGGEAFARLQGLLGKPVARPALAPEPPPAPEKPHGQGEPQPRREGEPAQAQEKTQDDLQGQRAVEVARADEETESGAQARQPAPPRAAEPAPGRNAAERRPVDRQEARTPPARAAAPPLANDKFVLHRVDLREKDREKAEEIVASAYEAAQTTGRKGVVPGGTGKFAWRPQLYNNAFGDKLRELHEAKVAAEVGGIAKSTVAGTEEGAASGGERPAEPGAEAVAEAAVEDVHGADAPPETELLDLAGEAREIDAAFDDEEVDPVYLETDADRYLGKPEPAPYNVHDNTIGFEGVDGDSGSEESFPEPDDMPATLRERAPATPMAREHAPSAPIEPPRQVTAPMPAAPLHREPEKAPVAPAKPVTQPSVRPPQVRPPARQVQSPARDQAASQVSPPRPAAAPSVRPPARQPSAQSISATSQSSRSTVEAAKPPERTVPPSATPASQAPVASPAVRPSGPPPGMMPRRSGFLPTTPVALADISPEALARATPDNPAIKTRIDPPPVSAPAAPPIAPRSPAPVAQETIDDDEEPPRQIRRPKWLDQLRDEDPPD